MHTTTKPRDADTDGRTSAPRRSKVWTTLLAAATLSLVGVLAAGELTSDSPRARSTPSPAVARTPEPAPPPAAPLETDFPLCALGVDGIEAAYFGPLVAETVSRYSARCSPAASGGEFSSHD